MFILESNEQITTRVIDQVKDNSLPISHINLGLLPSSKQSWTLANNLINKSTINTNVHIHENVHIDDFEKIKTDVKKFLQMGKFCIWRSENFCSRYLAYSN